MSQIINVSSKAELYDALANATGGETILMAEGNYGDITLDGKSGFGVTFPSEVTIASADPEKPAVFSSLNIEDAAHLTFDGITLDYEFQAGDPSWTRAATITDSSDITIRNSTFDGDLARGVSAVDDGYGTGVGLSTRGSTGVVIENNEFFDFYRGMTTLESSDVTVRGNDVHSIRSDGMNFSEVTGVLIEGNYIHDFRGSLQSDDHRDMLQFHTNNTDTPSTDITIRGNHFDIGEGDFTQSIFMRNEEVDRGRAGNEMFYSNVLIEDNVVVNGQTNGIRVGETNGLTIRNNSVLHADGRAADGADNSVEIPRIGVAPTSTNVTITNNITSDINGAVTGPGWTVRDNAIVQDQDSNAAGYYGDVFITSSLAMNGTAHQFLAVPGGALDTMNAGASATHDHTNVSNLTARFHVTGSEESAALYHFDASASSDGSNDLPAGTVYTWTFADGTVLTGERVSYAFDDGGIHNATLTLTLPNGQTNEAAIAVAVAGSNLVSYDTANGLVTYDDIPDPANGASARSTPPAGIVTAQQGVALSVDREHVVGIVGQDEFAISLTLQGNTPGDSGEIMRLNGSFILSVNTKGELYLRTFTEDGGQTRLTSVGANINDGNQHDVQINVIDNLLSITVDGEVRASTTMDSPLRGADGHNLVFGNPWNADNFESTITAFDMTVNASDFEAAAQSGPVVEPTPPAEPSPVAEAEQAPTEEGTPGPAPAQPEPVSLYEYVADPQLTLSENLAGWQAAQVQANVDIGQRICATGPERWTLSESGYKGSHDTRSFQEKWDAFTNMFVQGTHDDFL